jgi:D-glycero-D-manno-heptose 1,7-bisphosphate phosphatase
MKKAIFLDRDGVINKKPAEHDYVKKWEEMEILPGAKKALSLIKRSGYVAVVITNQRGVARGMMKAGDVHELHRKLNSECENLIDGFYCCFHDHTDNCDCRKPKPGLVHQAAREMEIDLEESWMIGDSESDVECGFAAGTKVIMMETNGNLWEEMRQIMGDGKSGKFRVKSGNYGNKETLR